jgi:hypothetical protein
MNPLGCKNDLQRKLADGMPLDDALAELRGSGYSIIDCIFAVHRVQHCEFIDAKKTVHFSPAWADMRAAHEKFHQELEDLAKQIADEDT